MASSFLAVGYGQGPEATPPALISISHERVSQWSILQEYSQRPVRTSFHRRVAWSAAGTHRSLVECDICQRTAWETGRPQDERSVLLGQLHCPIDVRCILLTVANLFRFISATTDGDQTRNLWHPSMRRPICSAISDATLPFGAVFAKTLAVTSFLLVLPACLRHMNICLTTNITTGFEPWPISPFCGCLIPFQTSMNLVTAILQEIAANS